MNDKELWELMSIICEGQDSEQRRKVEQYITDLRQENKKQKEVINKAVKYIDDLRDESAERQGFYNCFPDDLYIPDINELLDILMRCQNERKM